LMGSTRMKSGTAQKLVLNMITTTAMVKLGKVYENMMVNLQPPPTEAVERSRRIIMMGAGVEYEAAVRRAGEAGRPREERRFVMLTRPACGLGEARRGESLRQTGSMRGAIHGAAGRPEPGRAE